MISDSYLTTGGESRGAEKCESVSNIKFDAVEEWKCKLWPNIQFFLWEEGTRGKLNQRVKICESIVNKLVLSMLLRIILDGSR